MGEREELIDQRRAEERAHERTRLDLAAAIARAERAEAGLAALWDAGYEVRAALVDRKDPGRRYFASIDALGAVLADTAAAAEAYRASVEEATAPLRAEIDALDDLIPSSSSDEDPSVAQRTLVQRAEALCMDVTAAHRDLAIVTAERDAYAALDCSVQHDADRAALGVASLRAERAERERDTLAAALAEVRSLVEAMDSDALRYGLGPVLDAVAALPADLAAERFRRERAEALEAAADAIERGSVLSQYGAHGWLRARAADERGGK